MALSLDGTTGVSASGNVTGGNVLTGGLISATGNITGNYILGNGSALTGIDATSIQSGTSNVKVVSSGGNVTVGVAGTSNVIVVDAFGTYITGNLSVSGNATLSGNILGDRIQNGSTSLDIQVASGNANISVGGTSNVAVFATTGEYVTGLISATGNITGGNVLGGANVNATTHTGTTVSVSANITGGNVLTGGLISATGNVAGSFFVGNGSALTGIATGAASNISSGTSNVNIVSSGGNIAVGVGGTSNVAVFATTGEYVTGLISASGNITGGNVMVAGSGGNISGANIITATTLSATGNVVGGNVLVAGSGGNIAGANIITATTLSATGNVVGGNVTTAGLISATGNITTAGILTVNSGNAVTAIVNGGSNAVGNIGSSTVYFNRIFAQATTALYADLAEMYTADAQYPASTVVVFGGNQEITISTVSHDSRVAGVVSTNPAHIMNSGITGNCSIAVALTGRVPCQVVGPISKGDQVVSSPIAGVAERLDISQYQPGVVIGKSLEDHSGLGVGTIEIVVGRV
ncbi:hypothetical protein UFOVP1146_153 [uncultured Caudovirales phage]|uniref:Uncharacterized protein n=1 Tax=uncultured Caudovirales phage TaxID=2100421 RepID=A0A6J5T215_9CAUD|nr:hypothetical protein UFOVP812_66 [uncultured Caudovirales phage]CAB4165541.1 hypothetical protein UFOVP818_77 [uncultured Caudovirales phage]CAB4186807.1 hypothetical protein UFOVP1146_153 [uncultured Caudovirales phage]CAB4221589.1 hypothetical protein UFOVP1638_412 [uncultured Caudovirales phage]